MPANLLVKELFLDVKIPLARHVTDSLTGFDLSALLFRGFDGGKIETMKTFGTDWPERDFTYASPVGELYTQWPNNQHNPFTYAFSHAIRGMVVYDKSKFTPKPENNYRWKFINPNDKPGTLVALFKLL